MQICNRILPPWHDGSLSSTPREPIRGMTGLLTPLRSRPDGAVKPPTGDAAGRVEHGAWVRNEGKTRGAGGRKDTLGRTAAPRKPEQGWMQAKDGACFRKPVGDGEVASPRPRRVVGSQPHRGCHVRGSAKVACLGPVLAPCRNSNDGSPRCRDGQDRGREGKGTRTESPEPTSHAVVMPVSPHAALHYMREGRESRAGSVIS